MIGTIGLALASLSAGSEPIPVSVPDRSAPVSYAREVADVLDGKCVGCHNAALAENKLELDDVAAMLRGGKRGPALVPGKAEESLLFRMASHRVEPAMPPVGKKDATPLTPGELGLIKLWIDAGAADDSNEVGAAIPLELGSLPPGVHPILAVDITADGKLVAAGRGHRVRVYEVETGLEVASLAGHRDIVQSLRFSPDGSKLAAGSYRIVTLWDLPATGEAPSRTLGPHIDRVTALDFSPDGKTLAAGGGEPTRSGEIKLWDVATGDLVRSSPEGLHSDTVFGLAFSPDGKKIASASADKFLKVTNAGDGKDVRSFEGHGGHVLAVDWSADGKQLVTGGADSVLKVWDFETGDSLRTLRGAGKQVAAVRWGRGDGPPLVAAASGDKLVRFLNPADGGIRRSFSGPGDYAYGVAVSKDRKRVAAGGADGVLFLWNGDTAQVLRKIEP